MYSTLAVELDSLTAVPPLTAVIPQRNRSDPEMYVEPPYTLRSSPYAV